MDLWQALVDHHQNLRANFVATPGARDFYQAMLERLMLANEGLVLIAEVGGERVGYLVAEVEARIPIVTPERVIFILDAYVAEGYRRRGILAEMVSLTRDFAIDQQAPEIQLQVFIGNEEAATAWRALGFEVFLSQLRSPVPRVSPPEPVADTDRDVV